MANPQAGRKEKISLGDMISLFYEEYLAQNLAQGMDQAQAEELAAVAAAATINELLADQAGQYEA